MTSDGWARLFEGDNLSYLLDGFLFTLRLMAVAGVTSLALGFAIAAVGAIGSGWLRMLTYLFVGFFRTFPVLVVLLFVRFGLPLMGVPLRSAFLATVIAFTAYNGAMIAEVFRGAISSISKGQMEVALATGCSKFFAFRRIIVPQAVRLSLPGLAGQYLILLQGTTLVTIVGAPDLLHNATVIYSRAINPLETLLFVGAVYFVACSALARLRDYLERRIAL